MPENAISPPAKRPRSEKQLENDARNRERFKELWNIRKSANKSVKSPDPSVPVAVPAKKTTQGGSETHSNTVRDHSETHSRPLEAGSNTTRDHSEPGSKPKNKGLLGLGFLGL